ncbi:MAG: universal stress protein [Anaerolinea sp.]|nr:universal stress protein [Anaerolinea sp.]
MFQNILLAVDGSPHALRAAQVAAGLARKFGADLRVITAFDPVPPYLGEPNLQHAISARMKEAEAVLNAALEAVGSIPGELRSDLLEGPAAEAILAVARTRQNDLIIIGARGLGTLDVLLGSQSQKVLSHAPCPVLVVR